MSNTAENTLARVAAISPPEANPLQIAAAAKKPANVADEIDDSGFDKDTVAAAYAESLALYKQYPEWIDAIDKKAITVFTVATAIAGATTTFGVWDKGTPLSVLIPLGVALIGWTATVVSCWRAIALRDVGVGPDPANLLQGGWLSRPLPNYAAYRLRDMGKTLQLNRDQINAKAGYVTWALRATFVEVLALTIARFAEIAR